MTIFLSGPTIGFSQMEVQQMDAIISSFNAFEFKELGPLILAWALFLCLISSLPEKEENNLLMEIDHISYVRQAMDASSLGFRQGVCCLFLVPADSRSVLVGCWFLP